MSRAKGAAGQVDRTAARARIGNLSPGQSVTLNGKRVERVGAGQWKVDGRSHLEERDVLTAVMRPAAQPAESDTAREAREHNARVDAYNAQRDAERKAKKADLDSKGLVRRKWSSVKEGDTIDTNAGPGTVVSIRQKQPDSVTEFVGLQTGTNPYRIARVRVGDREREVQIDTRQTINVYKKPPAAAKPAAKSAPAAKSVTPRRATGRSSTR